MAMIILLVVILAATTLLFAMANIVISEILTATNEGNQVRAQNLAEAGLAMGWAAVENWSTWCSGAQTGKEPACPLTYTWNNVGGYQPQGGYAAAQIDTTSSPTPSGASIANYAVRVVVGYGNTTFSTLAGNAGSATATGNPTQLATGDAFVRQTALVLPAAFSFGIFSNTTAMVNGVSAMPPSSGVNNGSGMPAQCLTNAVSAGGVSGTSDVTDICQTMGPLFFPSPTTGAINIGYPLIGTVYANNNTVGNGVAVGSGGSYGPAGSPVTACNSTPATPSTLCLLPAVSGITSGASLTGPLPAVAANNSGTAGNIYSGAAAPFPLCNTGGCGSANVGTQYQFPAWNWSAMRTAANTQGSLFASAQAFYAKACTTWYNAGTKVTTIPAGMYLIEDQVVVFDNDPTRCLGNVVLQGGAIAVYCTGSGGNALCGSNNAVNYPPGNNLLGTGLSQLWSGSPEIPGGSPAPNSCSNTTPCGDIILGGPVTGTSPGCTPPSNPCSFTFQTSGYAGGGGADLNTPVLMAGGSIGSCASGCVNAVTYNGVPNNMVYVYGNGYVTGAGAEVCGTVGSDCNVAYILPP
ncbi:MAG TPA: hypothetical protein VK587_04240, partial [bacterium]|nr:hypothetical protein [bacterium]